jgi:hypothetical protein
VGRKDPACWLRRGSWELGGAGSWGELGAGSWEDGTEVDYAWDRNGCRVLLFFENQVLRHDDVDEEECGRNTVGNST